MKQNTIPMRKRLFIPMWFQAFPPAPPRRYKLPMFLSFGIIVLADNLHSTPYLRFYFIQFDGQRALPRLVDYKILLAILPWIKHSHWDIALQT